MSDCIHGRRSDRCVDCGGIGICAHKKRRGSCAKCGGSQICEHGIARSFCKKCKGSQICKHKNNKHKCRKCSGSQVCEHNNIQYNCLDCNGKGICKHGKHKGHCRKCNTNNYCEHSKHRTHCMICSPLSAAVARLCVSRADAKRGGFVPPNISASKLVSLVQASKRCFGCNGLLDWNNKESRRRPHLHHDHITGEVHGFCHPTCNQAEGMLNKLTAKERYNFIIAFFPEIFE
jgi:hypothetical protein